MHTHGRTHTHTSKVKADDGGGAPHQQLRGEHVEGGRVVKESMECQPPVLYQRAPRRQPRPQG